MKLFIIKISMRCIFILLSYLTSLCSLLYKIYRDLRNKYVEDLFSSPIKRSK